METRVGFVGIIVEQRIDNIGKVNEIISEYGDMIVARMGVPYKEKECSVINLVVDMTTDDLGRLTGKLGNCPGVSVKSALSKAK
jgi:putative iron-only hydrogenase system regulator